jgi:hypothetical protein
MDERYTFTHDEAMLLAELLEQELHELPVEIRHTRSNIVRQELHARLEMVQRMVERLRAPARA